MENATGLLVLVVAKAGQTIMRAGGGKQKGAQFERDACHHLSLWVSKGAQEDVFWRSAMSGGRSTVAHKRGKRLATQAGDITCIHPIGQPFADLFLLECKFYSSLNIEGLLTYKGHLCQFWQEVGEQGARYNKHPFLIAKQNRYPTIVCLTKHGLRHFKVSSLCILTAPRIDLHALLFDDFLKLPPL